MNTAFVDNEDDDRGDVIVMFAALIFFTYPKADLIPASLITLLLPR